MPERTLNEAIDELHLVVLALKELLEREYPDRAEVQESFRVQERKAMDAFVSKKVSQQRWVLLLLLAPIMIVSTFFLTIGTVSTCFLGRNTSNPPSVCSAIPGYTETRERQEEFTEEVISNRKLLLEIKKELEELK